MDLNIFVICHKPSKVLNSKIFRPIQVGAGLAKDHFEGYLHDDSGDNISEKNPYYCELTGMYWVWKHINADYYGFMHYRRYFSFSEKVVHPYADYPTLDMRFIREHGYDENKIQKFVAQYDIIAPMSEAMSETVYDQYKNSRNHHIEDLDIVLDIIKRKYPSYTQAANMYMLGKNHYFCNMFIMKKEIFFDYCNWLFPILEEHEKLGSRKNYNMEENRVTGFLAERLFGIYYTHLKMSKNIRFKDIPRIHFQNTDVQQPIMAIQSEKKVIPVVFSTNEAFMPYLAVTIQSIIANCSEQYIYHLIVLHSGGISENSVRKMEASCRQKENFVLHFYHVGEFLQENDFFVDKHLSIETYFRLFIQDILTFYDKVLYLDCDLVVQRDISDLYHINLDGKYLAAVRDIDYIGCWKLDSERKCYTNKVLGLKTGLDYFQAGVLVLNLQELRKHYSVKILTEIAIAKQWQFHDQDVLNYICRGKVYYLPQQWNVVMNWKEVDRERMAILRQTPKLLFDEYIASRRNPYIVHYAGYQKPWNVAICDYDYIFWHYAKQTVFYEQILMNLIRKTYAEKTQEGILTQQILNNKFLLNRIFPPGTKRRTLAKKIKSVLKL